LIPRSIKIYNINFNHGMKYCASSNVLLWLLVWHFMRFHLPISNTIYLLEFIEFIEAFNESMNK